MAKVLKILSSYIAHHDPTEDDWRNLYRPNEYQFEHSGHALGLKGLTVLFLILAVVHLGQSIMNAPQLWSWSNALNGLWGLCLIGGGLLLARKRWTLGSIEWLFGLLFLGGGAAYGAVFYTLTGNWVGGAVGGALGGAVVGVVGGALVGKWWSDDTVVGAVIGAMGGAVGGVVLGTMLGATSVALLGAVLGAFLGAASSALLGAVFGVVFGAVFGALLGAAVSALFRVVIDGPCALVYGLGGLWGLGLFWGVWWVLFLALYWRAKRCQREAENPLHGLLPGTGPTPSVSIQKGWISLLPKAIALPMRRPRGKRTGSKQ